MSLASIEPAEPAAAAPIEALVTGFLKVLVNERGVSTHTLRAYRRELQGFAAWINWRLGERLGERLGPCDNTDKTVQRIEHTDIRAYLGTLYDRGLSGAGAGGHSQLVQVAGADGPHRAERGLTGRNAAPAQTSAARPLD